METILNLLPLTAEEETAFRTAAPEAEHIFIPTRRRYAKYHLSPDLIARATVIIGCPRPALMADAISLRWLQTWSAGVDPYLDPGVIHHPYCHLFGGRLWSGGIRAPVDPVPLSDALHPPVPGCPARMPLEGLRS